MRVFVIPGLLLLAALPAHATVFGNGTVAAGALATFGAATNGISTAPGMLNGPGTITANSFGTITDGNYSVSSNVAVSASWASADAGSLDIDWGWNAATGGSDTFTKVETNLAIPNWTYTFTATGNGTFSGNYTIVGTGDLFGLQPAYGSGDLPFGPYGGSVNDPNGAGSFSIALVNGQTYTVGIYNFGNLSSNDGLDAVGNATARFDWQIAYGAVPEPGSWAMLIAGFGLVGAAARRRQAAIAT